MTHKAAAGLDPALSHAIETVRGLGACSPAQARRALACLDLTSLNDDDTDDSIRAFCARAVTPAGPVAAVCVYPPFVAAAKEVLGASPVKIATVVNFPGGADPEDAVVALTHQAVAEGADEIDVVLPYADFLAGRESKAGSMIASVRAAAGENRPVKTILEISQFPDLATIGRAARLAIAAGTTFVKTSTGKAGHGATLEACAVMLSEIHRSGRPELGLKPSGGIRTAEAAVGFVLLADRIMGDGWADPDHFRLGASGVVDALIAAALGQAMASDAPHKATSDGKGY